MSFPALIVRIRRGGLLFADVTGTIQALKSGAEMVMPGDNTTLTVELGESVAMAPGMRYGVVFWSVLAATRVRRVYLLLVCRFAIREGGRTVGAGVVSKVLN